MRTLFDPEHLRNVWRRPKVAKLARPFPRSQADIFRKNVNF
jgi:hypothetical protein